VSAVIEPRLPLDWVLGLHCSVGGAPPNDIVDISPGLCRDVDNTYNIDSTGIVSPDIGVSGLGGLDTGSVAANTWYSVWLIARTDTGVTGGLFSTSTTFGGLTLPASYDVGRRVGYVRTNGSSNITPFIQCAAEGPARWWFFEWNAFTNAELVSSGTITQPSWADAPLLGGGNDRFAPSAVRIMYRLTAKGTASNLNFRAQSRPKGFTSDNRYGIMQGGLVASNNRNRSGHIIMPTNVDGSRIVQYNRQSSSGTVDMLAIGWEDRL
jgi:hypothetical protein